MNKVPEILLATENAGKAREFERILRCAVRSGPAPAVVEDGTTYQENAEKKARAYFDAFHQPVLSDDSGLEVDGLNGKPGVHSARYGGAGISWPERWELLNKEIGDKSRSARFVCVLCYFDGRAPRFFEGACQGTVLKTPLGEKGFGYDPIFLSSDLGKSFGVARDAEKDRVSHRSRAAQAFRTWFATQTS